MRTPPAVARSRGCCASTGAGLAHPTRCPHRLPAWEAYAEELDAVGSRRAALLAIGPEAGPMALCFAGTRPERTSALILAHATARYLVADDYPIGVQSETAEAMIGRAEELWGTEAYVPTCGRCSGLSLGAAM